jgi:maltooligosyltrehalose synthase
MNGAEQMPLGDSWGDTELLLPSMLAGKPLRNVFTGETVHVPVSHVLRCADLLRHFPVALLVTS